MIRSCLQSLYNALLRQGRLRRVSAALEKIMPEEGDILDIGCGDGSVARRLQDAHPGLRFRGLEVGVRPGTRIPVEHYDGAHIPLPDASVDWAMLVTVLHHTDDYEPLIAEAKRVARKGILLLDHQANSALDWLLLMLIDWPGNVPFGVYTPYNFKSPQEWDEIFARLGLTKELHFTRLNLFGRLNFIFGRTMHFACRLRT